MTHCERARDENTNVEAEEHLGSAKMRPNKRRRIDDTEADREYNGPPLLQSESKSDELNTLNDVPFVSSDGLPSLC
jgi:hypothetical protein